MCEAVSDFLNLVFIPSPESRTYWDSSIRPSVEKLFLFSHNRQSESIVDFIPLTILMQRFKARTFSLVHESEKVRWLLSGAIVPVLTTFIAAKGFILGNDTAHSEVLISRYPPCSSGQALWRQYILGVLRRGYRFVRCFWGNIIISKPCVPRRTIASRYAEYGPRVSDRTYQPLSRINACPVFNSCHDITTSPDKAV
jgi:hypothetical protein